LLISIKAMKRCFDFLLSSVGLLVAAPIIAVLSIVIRAETPGPAIFRQRRVGRDGAPFICLKLRTMRQDVDEVPTHQSTRSDLTSVGRVLRRWKLDELPQLWNVFVGDMSFVGPRPCLFSQTELIEERRNLGVLRLRPGITGLAQVEGVDMSDPIRLAMLDATYIGRESLYTDILILVRTISPGALADRVGN